MKIEPYSQSYGLLLDVIEGRSQNAAYLAKQRIYFGISLGMLPYLSNDSGVYWKIGRAMREFFDSDADYLRFSEDVMIAAYLRHGVDLDVLRKIFSVDFPHFSTIANFDKRSRLCSGFLALDGEQGGRYVALCRLCGSYCEVSREEIKDGIRVACESCKPVFDVAKALERAETCYISRQDAEFKKAQQWANSHYLEIMRAKEEKISFFDDPPQQKYITKAAAIRKAQFERMSERFRFNSLTHALKYLGLPLFDDAEIHRIGHETYDVPNGPEVVPYGPISTIWKSQHENRSLKKTNNRVLYDGRVFSSTGEACRYAFGDDGPKVDNRLRKRRHDHPDLTPQAAFDALVSEIKG